MLPRGQASASILPHPHTLINHGYPNPRPIVAPRPSPYKMAQPTRPLTRDSVLAARTLIKPYIHLTPVQTNTTLSNLASTPQTRDALKGTQWEGQEPAKPKIRLWFKCENFQRIGAFKVRGAFHAVLRLIEEEGSDGGGSDSEREVFERGLERVRKRGVVTHSSGEFNPFLISFSKKYRLHRCLSYSRIIFLTLSSF